MFAAFATAAVGAASGVEECEGVVAGAGEVVDEDAAFQAAVPLLVPLQGGVHQLEAAHFDAGLDVGAFGEEEAGFGAFDVEDVACGVGAGREECFLLLAVAEAHVGGAGEQVAAEVHLAVLSVVDGDAVDGEGGELAAEAACGDGLDAADAAIVFKGHAGHLAHGVAELEQALAFDFFGIEDLCGYGSAKGRGGVLRRHLDLFQLLHSVDLCRGRYGKKDDGKEKSPQDALRDHRPTMANNKRYYTI